jgi:1-acyl-sn-glycerol-3-phosphate acyltransferase
MNFVAKKELFVFPLGYYFKYMGGAPLDRSGGKNKVDSVAAILIKRSFRFMVLPEGTRKSGRN